jgi:hypothetical protein
LQVNEGWRHPSKFFFCVLKKKLPVCGVFGHRPDLEQRPQLGQGLGIGCGAEDSNLERGHSRVVRSLLAPPHRQRGLLTDLPRRTTCKAMLRLTRTFIVTSIAKSSDRTQGRPARKNHATAATALENNELTAEP